MKFKNGDEVMIKKNNDHNYKRFSRKKGKIIYFSVVFSRYALSIDNHIVWIPEKYIMSELEYFFEDFSNQDT